MFNQATVFDTVCQPTQRDLPERIERESNPQSCETLRFSKALDAPVSAYPRCLTEAEHRSVFAHFAPHMPVDLLEGCCLLLEASLSGGGLNLEVVIVDPLQHLIFANLAKVIVCELLTQLVD